MNVTIEHLRCFKVMAETLNFTAAAQKSHIAQPALSRTLSSLEAEWNVRLFDRSTRRVILTPEGELCLARVKTILREYDRMLEDLSTGPKDLSIGFNSASGTAPWLIAALRQFKNEYPQVNIHVHQLHSSEAVFKLISGELDCAVIYEHSAALVSGLETMRLAPLYRHVIVPQNDPLAQKKMLTIHDLQGRHMVFMKAVEEFTYDKIHSNLRKHGIKPQGETIVSNLAEMALQAELGGGIGITGLISQYDNNTNVKLLPFEPLEDEANTNYAAFARREDNENKLVSALGKILKTSAKDP